MLYAQGDMIIEKVANVVAVDPTKTMAPDSDKSVVIGRGEVTGHRHRFTGDSGVVMFRDDGLARDMPPDLYVGHLVIPSAADLVHEEHATISLTPGTYRVRRQREWTAEAARVVAD